MAEYNALHKDLADKVIHTIDVVYNAKAFADLFSEDGTFAIANIPLCKGHEQIANGAQGMLNMLKSVKHVANRVLSVSKDTFTFSGEVTYVLPDDRRVSVNYLSVIDMDPDHPELIKTYVAYLDLSPLFVAIGLDITADGNGNVTMVPRMK